LTTPYPDITWFSWLWMMMESLAVTGNAFGYVTSFDQNGKPAAILPIHPNNISLQAQEVGKPEYYIGTEKQPGNRIVHIKRFPIAGQALRDVAGSEGCRVHRLGLAAERYGLRYFRDSANPSGILTTDAELTPEQQKRAMKSWILSHQGRRLPAVMSGGLQVAAGHPDPRRVAVPRDALVPASDIAMWFRVPPFMIGDTEKSRRGAPASKR
jgi:phage portal protein BeeE